MAPGTCSAKTTCAAPAAAGGGGGVAPPALPSALRRPTSRRRSAAAPVRIPLKRGELSKHGYSGVKHLGVAKRRAALARAAAQLGWGTVQKKLMVLYIYNKNRNPALAALFRSDATYARSQRLRS